LDASNSRSGRRALWEFRVESYEGAEVRSLPGRLLCMTCTSGEKRKKKRWNCDGQVDSLMRKVVGLTRIEGEAILGGTSPERFRRTRDACIGFQSVTLRCFLPFCPVCWSLRVAVPVCAGLVRHSPITLVSISHDCRALPQPDPQYTILTALGSSGYCCPLLLFQPHHSGSNPPFQTSLDLRSLRLVADAFYLQLSPYIHPSIPHA
jgi:hypothetical protein